MRLCNHSEMKQGSCSTHLFDKCSFCESLICILHTSTSVLSILHTDSFLFFFGSFGLLLALLLLPEAVELHELEHLLGDGLLETSDADDDLLRVDAGRLRSPHILIFFIACFGSSSTPFSFIDDLL